MSDMKDPATELAALHVIVQGIILSLAEMAPGILLGVQARAMAKMQTSGYAMPPSGPFTGVTERAAGERALRIITDLRDGLRAGAALQ